MNKIESALFGHLVGDATGVPYEFHSPDNIPEKPTMVPPTGFSRTYSVAPGTWSDDGALMLCLAESLASQGAFSAADFGDRMVMWYEQGYMAVDANVFDIGGQTRYAVSCHKSGKPVTPNENSNGNGSLMRVLPVGLFFKDVEDIICVAEASSEVSHPHYISKACCAFYSLWAHNVLLGASFEDGWVVAREDLHVARPSYDSVVEHVESFRSRGSGYVVDCLASAKDAVMAASSYEDAITRAIRFGHDTDTTACVAGGVAALHYGVPEELVNLLQDAHIAKDTIDHFVRTANWVSK